MTQLGVHDSNILEISMQRFVVIQLGVQGALPYFSILCEAVTSWRQIRDPGLLNEMASVMQLYKQSLSAAGQWDAAKASLTPSVLEKLQQTYSV